MKLFVVTVTAICSGLISVAQANNPQDQVGINFVSSLRTIKSDFDAGRVSTIDESTVASYSSSLPLNLSARFEDITAIVNQTKSADFSFDKTLGSSSLSQFSKDILSDLAKNPSGLNKIAYLADVVSKVSSINQTFLPVDEKKLMLSLAAIVYHIVDSDLTARSQGCFANGPDGSGPADCQVVGAVIGGVIGSLVCGLWPCGVIGAFVGAVLGGLS